MGKDYTTGYCNRLSDTCLHKSGEEDAGLLMGGIYFVSPIVFFVPSCEDQGACSGFWQCTSFMATVHTRPGCSVRISFCRFSIQISQQVCHYIARPSHEYEVVVA